jgi:transcriptional regulator with XRE-family HTH domain
MIKRINRKHELDVKAIRKRHGWTQEQAAREFGVTVRTLTRWECEGSKPSPLALQQILKADRRPIG